VSERKSVESLELDGAPDRYATRRREWLLRRSARRADRRAAGWGWLGGIVLIAIGALLMLQNAGYFPQFSNWWALFILLPAAGSFSAGLGAYRRSGDLWTREVVGLFLAAALFASLTAVFLFNLNLSIFGPLLMIGAGLLLLFGPR
jgi:hypothetical protein